jgi:hypothetical protein
MLASHDVLQEELSREMQIRVRDVMPFVASHLGYDYFSLKSPQDQLMYHCRTQGDGSAKAQLMIKLLETPQVEHRGVLEGMGIQVCGLFCSCYEPDLIGSTPQVMLDERELVDGGFCDVAKVCSFRVL